MHGYRYPEHEARIGDLARAAGFTQVSESHRTSPLMKLVSRGDTTVVDAYLSPILQRYVTEVAAELKGVRLLFMQSNGGLTDAAGFRGKDSILSGPAGGIVGMARTAADAGFDQGHRLRHGRHLHRRVALRRRVRARVRDAGRRRADARPDAVHPHRGRGRRLHPALRRQPVPGRPRLGRRRPRPGLLPARRPAHRHRRQRAARPHPAGPLPAGLRRQQGDQPLDADITKAKFTELSDQITADTGDTRGPEEVAAGFTEIAVANMANAIKKISVQRGYDVTEYVLNVFGGAGGQHACAVADALGMTRVLIHPLAGVLSAYGIGLADIIAMREQAVEAPLTADGLETAGRDHRSRSSETPAPR